MSDFDDDLIYGAFDKFADAAAPSVKIAGTASVRATVRHRRVVRATALTVLGALLIAAPVATYAVTSHGSKAPPSLAAASPSPVATVSVAPSTAPSTPPASPSSTPTVPGTPGTGGEMTIAQLKAARVTVPVWRDSLLPTIGTDCAGSLANKEIQIEKVVYTNLDSDPAPETAALVACHWGEVGSEQVVAFDRNAAGKIVTLGTVMEGHIWTLAPTAGNGVTIDISDYQACCETPKPYELHQTRSYAWNGTHFVQVGGPTSFISHTKLAHFKVSTSSSGWTGPDKAGNRTGHVTVKITNDSAVRTNPILVWDTSGTADVKRLGPAVKIVPGLAPGASETVTLTVDLFTDIPPTQCVVSVYELGSDIIGSTYTNQQYPLWK